MSALRTFVSWSEGKSLTLGAIVYTSWLHKEYCGTIGRALVAKKEKRPARLLVNASIDNTEQYYCSTHGEHVCMINWYTTYSFLLRSRRHFCKLSVDSSSSHTPVEAVSVPHTDKYSILGVAYTSKYFVYGWWRQEFALRRGQRSVTGNYLWKSFYTFRFCWEFPAFPTVPLTEGHAIS